MKSFERGVRFCKACEKYRDIDGFFKLETNSGTFYVCDGCNEGYDKCSECGLDYEHEIDSEIHRQHELSV